MEVLLPPNWPKPKGYSNGIVASGRFVFVSGQVGWDENEQFASDNFAEQLEQTLRNTMAVLAEAGASAAHVVRMTWYITDKQDYLANLARVGQIYREFMGSHYPVMSMVIVKGLLEERAKLEIETTAVVPE